MTKLNFVNDVYYLDRVPQRLKRGPQFKSRLRVGYQMTYLRFRPSLYNINNGARRQRNRLWSGETLDLSQLSPANKFKGVIGCDGSR